MPPKPAPAKGATAKKATPAKAGAAKPAAAKPAAKKATPSKPAAGATAKPAPKQDAPIKEALVMMGVEIGLKQLASNLDGEELKNSRRCPLIIDPSGNAVTFLKYRDTNVLYGSNPLDMMGPPIRRATLGSLRFGKPLVINMEEEDNWEKLVEHFDKVGNYPNLLSALIDRSIIEDENYKKLLTSEDGDEYHKAQEREWRVDDFKLILASTKEDLAKEVRGKFYTINIV